MPRSSGTQPMPARARASAERLARSAPSKVMAPSICRCSPMTERSSVVLPAPLRPTSVTTSPGATSTDTSVSTRASPYHAERPDTSSMRGRPSAAMDFADSVAAAADLAVVPVVVPLVVSVLVLSLMGGSEVCRDDALVSADLLVGTLREHLPRLEHGHLVGQRPDDVHVVVDEHDGASDGQLLDEGDRAVDVLDAHAGGGL